VQWSVYLSDYGISFSSPAIAEDGTIYIGGEDGYLYAVTPSGGIDWSFETGGAIESSPAIGLDGTIYFGSDDGYFYAVNPDGSEAWKQALGDPGWHLVRSSPVVIEDGTVYVGSYDSRLYAFSPDGTLLWSFRFDSAGDPFIGASGAVIGDLDHDGSPEIVFTTYSTSQSVSKLVILNAAGKALHIVPIEGRGSMSPPTLADVDSDGKIEIVISLKDALGSGLGGVQVWDVSSALTGSLPWPTGRGNQLRNGRGVGPE